MVRNQLIAANFVGLDLAWSDRNPSGLALLQFHGRGAELYATAYLTSDKEIIDWIECHSTATTWVGIDAPIIAPNPAQTARPVDRLVTSLFGRYHAGVYPGNQERCARPIRLSLKLAEKGFSPDPFLSSQSGRRQLEIFPHLAQVRFFKRNTIIPYKKGEIGEKQKGLQLFQQYISRFLPRQDPPLISSLLLRSLLQESRTKLRGLKLKELEDTLDALLCAYMTVYFWKWGQMRCEILGDLETGYIIAPKFK